MADFLSEAQNLFEYTRALRRDFHRHPELGFQEVRTAGIVANTLNELGMEVNTGIGETGVVGLLAGGDDGPVVMIRFDMDGLPITEETGAEYASVNRGVMHACGHDGHLAVGLTVARLLTAHCQEFSGRLKFVFQPAEEGLGGAESMITDGVLEDPRPDMALGLHLWNEKQVGWLGISPGYMMAAAEMFEVRIIGKGGHGALPHLATDPVLAAAHLITALQSITARDVPPLEAAVVSVTTVHGGEAFNIIPSDVKLSGTLRTFSPEVRQRVMRRFQRISTGVGEALGCQVDVHLKLLTPAMHNDATITARVQEVAARLLPEHKVDVHYQAMVSEDMAFMMQEIPGCYFLVGSANSEKGLDAPHHHPHFDIDEESLPQAAALMASAAFDLLSGQADA